MAKRKKNQKSGIHGERAVALEVVKPTPEFAAKHLLETVKTDLGGKTLQVRNKRPIDTYRRLYCIDEERGIGETFRRGINDDQFRAADRFANNYERCFPSGSKPIVGMRVQCSINVGMYPNEMMVNAIHKHTRILKDLSRVSQEIVEAICCQEQSLLAFEQSKGWRKGYGMTRLRESLDELSEAFRRFSKP
jgi:Domain of unknown function (DUF6456)